MMMLQACSSSNTGRYSMKQDSAPQFYYGDIEYIEPTPVYEPYNVWTSRPYEVLGGFYTPMQDAKGHEDIGYASWYGQKFHGHTTANGEIFDMFSLTAAHKTLPLPSFLRVTNLENNKTTTVRVNDRGPFHDDRILDLSYAAAKKLGFHSNGVAKVKIEVIHVSPSGVVTIGNQTQTEQIAKVQVHEPAPRILRPEVAAAAPPSMAAKGQSTTDIRRTQGISSDADLGLLDQPLVFVQVAATSDERKARELANGLSNLLQVPNSIPKVNNVYRLHLGPLENEQSAKKLIQDLKNIGFDSAFRVEFSPQ
jgi:rare lipoprotein A